MTTDPAVPAPADPDRACNHDTDTNATVNVARITQSETDDTVVAWMAEIQVECRSCGEPFRWNGVQAGLNYARPMCTVDEKTLLAPMRPASADPDFGLGLPGFAVNMRA